MLRNESDGDEMLSQCDQQLFMQEVSSDANLASGIFRLIFFLLHCMAWSVYLWNFQVVLRPKIGLVWRENAFLRNTGRQGNRKMNSSSNFLLGSIVWPIVV